MQANDFGFINYSASITGPTEPDNML